MMREKISVIIPVYNKDKWIGRCLESIMKQTYENLEILVIDDGSTDGSFDVVKNYADRDSRVRFVRQNNLGVASARNRGLNNVTGDIVTFVDADDYIENDMYEKMISVMQRRCADIIECSCRKVRENGCILQNIILQEETICGKRQCVKHYLRQKNVRNYMCNKLYDRRLFAGLAFPILRYSEDYYMNALVHSRSKKKIILSDICYNYMIYEGQATDLNKIGSANFDGVKAGRLVTKYFWKDRELRTYAAIYACEYAIRTAKQYICRYPNAWNHLRKYIGIDFLYCCLSIALVEDIDPKMTERKQRYLEFWLNGKIGEGLHIQAFPELTQRTQQQEKYARLLKIMCRWVQNCQKNINVSEILVERGIRSVAIYGAGDVGRCLVAELSDSDISVQYVIDRRRLELEVPVYMVEEVEVLPVVDCVIVTAVMDFDEICKDLVHRMDCQVLSIEDIIFEAG